MELFNTILNNINIVLTAIIGLAFTSQLMYTLFFFLPAKKYKKAKTKHKFAIFIPARNEANVIQETIKNLQMQNYPKDLYDIYVIADNCTDNTAQLAREAGAIVLEHFDNNPKHARVSYALEFFFKIMLQENKDYEAYCRFDADNFAHPDYLEKMNDALDSGVKLGRAYNNAKNLTQNVVTGVSALWYIRDCRFASQARSFLNTAQMCPGPGMMISAEIIKENGGWTAMGITEDAEFTMDELFKKHKFKYVKDAITYEDHPSTIKDSYKRYVRIGHGTHKLFYTHGLKSLGLFFTRFGWSYLDMFFTLLFIPIAVLCCTWLPFYYTYTVIYNFCVGNTALAYTILKGIGYSLIFAFILPFILQGFLVYILERKRINQPFKKVLPSILMFPMFMIIYAFSIFMGAITIPKWKPIKRNTLVTSESFQQSLNQNNIEKRKEYEKTLSEEAVVKILNEENIDNNNEETA